MDILNKIIEQKKKEVACQKAEVPLSIDELKTMCLSLPPVSDFIAILKTKKSQNKMALIAEIKKASPSKGVIREDFNPVEIAFDYQKSGAAAISVLTDEKFFQGSFDYFNVVRNIVKLPLLRKDFIIDPFQIYQTRLMGADIILLIASALDKNELKEFYELSKEIGLNVLVEVHDKSEFELALEIGADIIGINNRNLRTFEVSIDTTIDLIKDKDLENTYIISESGISKNEEVKMLKDNDVSGVLAGEIFMRQENVSMAVADLMGDCI